jgi:hypothetical protein
MRVAKLFMACSIVMVIVPSVAQVQTNIPTAVPGAKPVKVEHIKVHGAALEGNLEGDAVDRDVIVFLPPAIKRTRSAAIQLSMRCTVTPLAPSNGRTRFMFRRPLRAPLQKVRRK